MAAQPIIKLFSILSHTSGHHLSHNLSIVQKGYFGIVTLPQAQPIPLFLQLQLHEHSTKQWSFTGFSDQPRVQPLAGQEYNTHTFSSELMNNQTV